MIQFKFRQPLDELANKWRTDKGTEYPGLSRHGYAPFYDSLLSKWRGEKIRMLEIGVWMEKTRGGSSILMWNEYFDDASIFTFDIVDMSDHPVIMKNDNVFFYKGDQGKRTNLASMQKQFGRDKYDFILDDGSHWPDHQVISFAHLFRHVKSGGYYIIEDISQPGKPCCCIRNDETHETIFNFMETGQFESPYITDAEKEYLEENIENVEAFADMQDAYMTIAFTKK